MPVPLLFVATFPINFYFFRDIGAGDETIYLHDMALSGSGKEVKGEHILYPRSGESARGHISAWVVHSSAAAADALSTAFIVMGPEEAEQFCRDNPNIWAKLVEKSGAVRVYNPAYYF